MGAAAERLAELFGQDADIGALGQCTSTVTTSPATARISKLWITIARALRSTSIPWCASLYSGTPFCLTAEYIGGTWSIAPRNRAIAASTAARSMPAGIAALR
jgi:hypothetical protein